MTRLARFGNARTPTWLRTTTALNTNANTAAATKHTPVKHLPRRKKKDGQRPFARSAAPSPPSAASTGTLAAETPAPDCPLARKTSSSSSSSLPPVVTVDDDDDDDDCRRREVVCYRTCNFEVEFRLVQRRSGLLAMRRSRKARHRRERGYLAGMFRLVGVDVDVEEDNKVKGKDTSGCEGGGGVGEEGPVCWDLLEKMLDMERETTEE